MFVLTESKKVQPLPDVIIGKGPDLKVAVKLLGEIDENLLLFRVERKVGENTPFVRYRLEQTDYASNTWLAELPLRDENEGAEFRIAVNSQEIDIIPLSPEKSPELTEIQATRVKALVNWDFRDYQIGMRIIDPSLRWLFHGLFLRELKVNI